MMNSRGSITVDYLFAFFLVSGFSMVIITFSLTLTMVEVVQYMSYAAARNYFAGHISQDRQSRAAAEKFFSLKTDPAIAVLLSGGWFEVPNQSFMASSTITQVEPFREYNPNPQHNLFHGVVVAFNAKILDFQVPFFGSTKKSNADGEAQGFKTNITAFLGREPTFTECNRFNADRWTAIRRLPALNGASNYSYSPPTSEYIVINDNGG